MKHDRALTTRHSRSAHRAPLLRLPLAVALVAMLAAPALASGGRRPIHAVPITITEPGSYYLTRDLTLTSGAVGITIASSNVTIDFMGHTLTKTSAGIYTVSMDGDYTGITLRNGRIIGGNIGIRLVNNTGADFAARIEGMDISGSLNAGIDVEGWNSTRTSDVVIRNNTVHDVGGSGISTRYIWGGRIEGNVVRKPGPDAGDHGIFVNNCEGVTITGNTISAAGGDGIRIDFSSALALDWNQMSSNGGWGMNLRFSDTVVFSNNRAYGNTTGGFRAPLADGHVDAGANYPPLI